MTTDPTTGPGSLRAEINAWLGDATGALTELDPAYALAAATIASVYATLEHTDTLRELAATTELGDHVARTLRVTETIPVGAQLDVDFATGTVRSTIGAVQ